MIPDETVIPYESVLTDALWEVKNLKQADFMLSSDFVREYSNNTARFHSALITVLNRKAI